MVTLSKTRSIETQDAADGLARKKLVLSLTLLGLALLILPFIFIFVNPIQMLANFQLRIAKGTLLNELLLQEIEGAKLYVYLFNITNAERFLEGHDHILKVDEVGPFVYQEYRTNDDLEINIEPGIMRYTPNYRSELIIEESVGRPEDIFLVVPNIALLSAVQILSTYPYFIRQICKVVLTSMNMKALSRISAYTYLWGNTDPLILMVNSAVPGLIYYNSTGLMTRIITSVH
ncbi:Scavenger receptor class B member 1 like protein 15 [Operophtera brumata]|uniref:Scavenger receptor class B member 1 n=1 Tax=Operophtera brumata TaxID=104452 RepID=A0A0L7KYD5_OPEBR|nr:Scavenger receptor class B member 1 like protein 15 [Operophtera brumata]